MLYLFDFSCPIKQNAPEKSEEILPLETEVLYIGDNIPDQRKNMHQKFSKISCEKNCLTILENYAKILFNLRMNEKINLANFKMIFSVNRNLTSCKDCFGSERSIVKSFEHFCDFREKNAMKFNKMVTDNFDQNNDKACQEKIEENSSDEDFYSDCCVLDL